MGRDRIGLLDSLVYCELCLTLSCETEAAEDQRRGLGLDTLASSPLPPNAASPATSLGVRKVRTELGVVSDVLTASKQDSQHAPNNFSLSTVGAQPTRYSFYVSCTTAYECSRLM